MKVEFDENGDVVLQEVFSGIALVSEAGEEFGICMRDSGFEFNYGGYWYEAKEGKLTLLGPDEYEDNVIGQEGSFEETTEGYGEFHLDKVYSQKNLTIYAGYIWRYVGKPLRNYPGPNYKSFPYTQVKSIGTFPSEDNGWRKIEKRM